MFVCICVQDVAETLNKISKKNQQKKKKKKHKIKRTQQMKCKHRGMVSKKKTMAMRIWFMSGAVGVGVPDDNNKGFFLFFVFCCCFFVVLCCVCVCVCMRFLFKKSANLPYVTPTFFFRFVKRKLWANPRPPYAPNKKFSALSLSVRNFCFLLRRFAKQTKNTSGNARTIIMSPHAPLLQRIQACF